jgi:NADP-dependent 3-hydroxy acid dehydrogenase YdfG
MTDTGDPASTAQSVDGMIAEKTMLRAEDIAVGVHYLPSQPNRVAVRPLTIAPRNQPKD